MLADKEPSIFADLAAHQTSDVYYIYDLDRRADSDLGSLTTLTKIAEIEEELSRRDTDLIIRRCWNDTASNCSMFVLIP